MKPLLKSVQNSSGYDEWPLNQKTNAFWHPVYPKKERNIFIAERFIAGLVKIHGKHPSSTDGSTWYPQTCRLESASLYSLFTRKALIERTMQYIKGRDAECFDDYFPCRKKKCKLKHVKQWLNLFIDQHNGEIIS